MPSLRIFCKTVFDQNFASLSLTSLNCLSAGTCIKFYTNVQYTAGQRTLGLNLFCQVFFVPKIVASLFLSYWQQDCQMIEKYNMFFDSTISVGYTFSHLLTSCRCRYVLRWRKFLDRRKNMDWRARNICLQHHFKR